jgi:hypothetical protein
MPNKPPRNKQTPRSRTATRSAASLLQGISALRGLDIPSKQELAGAGALRERLRRLLPGDLAAHLLEARSRAGELVLFTESAAWAGRLRMALAERAGSTAVPTLPELQPDTRVVVRVMPREGYRR